MQATNLRASKFAGSSCWTLPNSGDPHQATTCQHCRCDFVGYASFRGRRIKTNTRQRYLGSSSPFISKQYREGGEGFTPRSPINSSQRKANTKAVVVFAEKKFFRSESPAGCGACLNCCHAYLTIAIPFDVLVFWLYLVLMQELVQAFQSSFETQTKTQSSAVERVTAYSGSVRATEHHQFLKQIFGICIDHDTQNCAQIVQNYQIKCHNAHNNHKTPNSSLKQSNPKW